MHQGAYISGLGHAALIVWAMLAGFFFHPGQPPPVETMDVSVLTAEEFAALTAPPLPDLPQPDEVAAPAPVAPPVPAPDAVPESEPAAEAAPLPAPAPLPPAPPPSEAIPDQPVAPDTPPAPPEAERVAPEAAPAPPEEAEVAPQATPRIAPAETAETVAEEQPAAAPEEAATEIVTEAETPSSAAPVRSMLPMARPRQLAAAAAPEPEPDPQPEPDPADAVAEALAQAAAQPPRPDTPAGPPLTSGERDVFRLAVQNCWVVDVGSQAANVVVTIGFSLDPAGKVVGSSLRLLSAEGGEGAAANSAFEAARRAILRCQKSGYPLPRDKYQQWQDVEMTFNPKNMRIR